MSTCTRTRTATRFATRNDAPVILQLIRELAKHENLSHEVTATGKGLERPLFDPTSYAEVLIAEEEDVAAGFCLFFHNYSSPLGKPGIYREDIFMRPSHRGKGRGRESFVGLGRREGTRLRAHGMVGIELEPACRGFL